MQATAGPADSLRRPTRRGGWASVPGVQFKMLARSRRSSGDRSSLSKALGEDLRGGQLRGRRPPGPGQRGRNPRRQLDEGGTSSASTEDDGPETEQRLNEPQGVAFLVDAFGRSSGMMRGAVMDMVRGRT